MFAVGAIVRRASFKRYGIVVFVVSGGNVLHNDCPYRVYWFAPSKNYYNWHRAWELAEI